MALSAGSRLGVYEILGPLGAGGMGEVYRAKDTRLGREVAIKVLPADVVTDPRRLSRFEREAQAVSALNHPNIVTLYEVGRSETGPYLVLERVDGELLTAVIRGGSIPVRRLLSLGAQIAAGLAKAHEAGIVHRDLKPDNVMVTPDGFAKILDFGLARLMVPDDERGQIETVTLPGATAAGAVLGTVGYLSPEQAAGRPADHRADQFALGALLYEMATGERPFRRETVLETLTATIRDEPEPVRSKRSDLPSPVAWLIDRCLAKNPEDRYASTRDLARDLADLRDRLTEISGTRSGVLPAPAGRSRLRRWMLPGGVLLVAIAAAATAWLMKPATSATPFHVSLAPPRDAEFIVGRNVEGGLALSPNGRMLAFVASTKGRSQLWIRRLDMDDARPIPGTDLAQQPFWSPDSQHIAFYTPSKLVRLAVESGTLQTLTDVDPRTYGGAWMSGDVLLVTGRPDRAIHRMSAAGGPTTFVADGVWPAALPGGERFLFTTAAGIAIGSLSASDRVTPIAGLARSRAIYAAGHLLFMRDRQLMAVPFDPAGHTRGEPFTIADPVLTGLTAGEPSLQGTFSATEDGVLVFAGGNRATRLRWRNRSGDVLGDVGTPGGNVTPRIAPDGRRVAYGRAQGVNTDLWIAEDDRSPGLHLTFDPGSERWPVWSPDGRSVTYSASTDKPNTFDLFRKAADGSLPAEPLTSDPSTQHAMDWSADGRWLSLTQNFGSVGTDLRILHPPARQSSLILRTVVSEAHSQFRPAPQPRWIAYSSDEVGGQREIWIAPFDAGKPLSEARRPITRTGGTMPRWRGDGLELYYWALDGQIMAITIEDTPTGLRPSEPKPLFTVHRPTLRTNDIEFDVTRDGQRFLLVEPTEGSVSQPLTIMVNWLAMRR